MYDDDVDLEVAIASDERKATLASLYLSYTTDRGDYVHIETTGAATRSPEDRYDPDVGALLATSRALARMAAKLERRARGEVKHQADMREYQKLQAQRESLNPGEKRVPIEKHQVVRARLRLEPQEAR